MLFFFTSNPRPNKGERERERERQTDRQTDRDTQTDRQRETDRQTDRDRQTETDRQRAYLPTWVHLHVAMGTARFELFHPLHIRPHLPCGTVVFYPPAPMGPFQNLQDQWSCRDDQYRIFSHVEHRGNKKDERRTGAKNKGKLSIGV